MHTLRRSLIAFFALTLIFVLVAPVAATRPARQDDPPTEPVTLYLPWVVNANVTLDPQVVPETSSGYYSDNTFLGLTSLDYETGTVTPELATSWTTSEDGRVWTFTLRDDVPWVRWNAAVGEIEVVRMVTADDAVYGIQRACDPRVGAPYQYLAANIIAGCDDLAQRDPEHVTDADYERVQVRALDDVTLEITLQYPAGYFLSLSHIWMFRPVPREVVEEYGATWADPQQTAQLVTNGPFVLTEFVLNQRAVAHRNPALPDDLQSSSNVERVILTQVDVDQAFALYQAGQLDSTFPRTTELESLTNDPAYANQFEVTLTTTVWYIAFTHDKPPFDNVHVRRAFATMLDLPSFWAEAPPLLGYPMIHITPPGIFGAPPIDEVGVGFDPDYAREQLALAGYPDCEGLPQVEIATFASPNLMAYIAESAETVLGCDPGLFSVNWVTFEGLVALLDRDLAPDDRPSMYHIAWGHDYPDANNYVGDFLGCTAANATMRPCGPIDDLIAQAARETDIMTRVALYRDIEERFFGYDGEFPVIPVLLETIYELWQPWITRVDDGIGYWDRRIIDQEMQLAARGE